MVCVYIPIAEEEQGFERRRNETRKAGPTVRRRRTRHAPLTRRYTDIYIHTDFLWIHEIQLALNTDQLATTNYLPIDRIYQASSRYRTIPRLSEIRKANSFQTLYVFVSKTTVNRATPSPTSRNIPARFEIAANLRAQ